MNDVEKLLLQRLERIAGALEKQKTLVPIIVFIPSSVRPDQLHEVSEMFRRELRRAGFDLPEATDG